MELLVLGIGIMALGATLVHLAIEGRKAAMAPVAATRTLPRQPLLSVAEPEETPDVVLSATAAASDDEFTNADVLLADALTELLVLKEQVTSLQARVDSLTLEASAHKAAAEPRHAVKHLRRRAAHGFA